ncbi:MAG: protein translocase subunit SecF [Elusimicrobiota bacterium]|jgi:preprotein translocase subunit SecF|nr:protein translocase subunit SecF [Elusimicrobiota bacterium]
MQFFKETHIDFVGNRYKFFGVSAFLVLLTVSAFLFKGPNYSIDFVGGIFIQISFQNEVPLQSVRSSLEKGGIISFELQNSANIVMLRAKHELKTQTQDEFVKNIQRILAAAFPNNHASVDRVEYVGPTVGAYLSKQAVYAFLFAFLGMIIYVAFRFKSGLWGIASVLGIIHDVLVSFGFVVLVGKEVDVTVIAALLTIAGYSINDTIVLFDRIRENLRISVKESFYDIINKSINAVLVRTAVTSITVFFVAISLFFLGGEVIHTFAYIMLIGTVLGVFSTIFLCTPLVYEWEISRNKRLNAALKQGIRPK